MKPYPWHGSLQMGCQSSQFGNNVLLCPLKLLSWTRTIHIDEARKKEASSALWLIRNYQFFSKSSQYESKLSESEKDLVTDASGLWAS